MELIDIIIIGTLILTACVLSVQWIDEVKPNWYVDDEYDYRFED